MVTRAFKLFKEDSGVRRAETDSPEMDDSFELEIDETNELLTQVDGLHV